MNPISRSLRGSASVRHHPLKFANAVQLSGNTNLSRTTYSCAGNKQGSYATYGALSVDDKNRIIVWTGDASSATWNRGGGSDYFNKTWSPTVFACANGDFVTSSYRFIDANTYVVIVLRYNPNATLVWQTEIIRTDGAMTRSLTLGGRELPNGNIAITGTLQIFETSGQDLGMVAILSSSGTLLNIHRWLLNQQQTDFSLYVTDIVKLDLIQGTPGYLVAGFNRIGNWAGGTAWVLRLDESFNLLSHFYIGSDPELLTAIDIVQLVVDTSEDSNWYLFMSAGSGAPPVPNLLWKFNEAGTVLWKVTFNNTSPMRIHLSAQNDLILVGDTSMHKIDKSNGTIIESLYFSETIYLEDVSADNKDTLGIAAGTLGAISGYNTTWYHGFFLRLSAGFSNNHGSWGMTGAPLDKVMTIRGAAWLNDPVTTSVDTTTTSTANIVAYTTGTFAAGANVAWTSGTLLQAHYRFIK